MSEHSTFNKTVVINTTASQVWAALTQPLLMKQWMSEPGINIITDWKVGGSFIINGDLHGIPFENTGKVLQYSTECVLAYSHSSSLSNLPDVPGSYSVFEFRLTPVEDGTNLTLTITNFPTEAIYRHLVFYWNVTLELLKKFIEQDNNS
ncbi:MAG: Activator of Hsp90 ATPase 1 family protein [Flavipsychrobacter sp.]|nr:Activator of Hsp90 ATPase 1 family protein [Flavipsychrobacter sp.]